ncbi:MAG: indole-3-glycerol-phosphate synthase [Bacteroidetes bacterium]|nr:MAG: indole-3-glycerol-phosphate synthase [Bacteroidota bacterium]TAE69319.1 MAG: indole-3-glycerol-phosphate synthase [Bacteroidota bacterium]
MTTILDKIVAYKQQEVAAAKQQVSLEQLKDSAYYHRQPLQLTQSLQKSTVPIIAEFKRASPSKGIINAHASLQETVEAYALHASAVSILTDEPSFHGNLQHVRQMAEIQVPILRKDFMIDAYQIHEAKAAGASIILLIAAILSKLEIEAFTALAHELGMQVLLELHHPSELDKVVETVDTIGVNNRNLQTFEVNPLHVLSVKPLLPTHIPLIAESGLQSIETVVHLYRNGCVGFLMGEHFMKQPIPAIAFAQFVEQLKQGIYES